MQKREITGGKWTVFPEKYKKDKELTKKEVEHIQCEVYSEMCFKMYKCQDSEMEEFWNWLCEKNK